MIAFLRDLFFRDFWLKLFSLALAVLIWLTVSFVKGGGTTMAGLSGTPEQTYVNIPVNVMAAAADVRDFKVSPSEVDVRVRGDANKLKALRPQEIHALIDLTGIEAARGLRKRIEITTPPGIAVVEVNPTEAEVIVPPKR